MNIEKIKVGNNYRFSMQGALLGTDKDTYPLFDAIASVMDEHPEEIILDMALVTAIDSMAIGLMVGLLLKSREKERTTRFRVTNMVPRVRAVLETTRLDKIFTDLF